MKIKNYFSKNKLLLSFLILLFFFSLFMTSFCISDNDYFWHIKAGKYMVEHSTILRNDIFSWSLYSKYWVSHEWLFEVFIYGLSLITKHHIFIYCFITCFLLLLLLFMTNKKEYLKNIPFAIVWISIFFFFGGIINPRPQLLSYLLFAFTIYALYDLWKNQNSKKIYLLPIITIIWANIHGGSSNLSYLFCLFFMVCGLFKFKFSKIEADRLSNKQLLKYFIVFILCIFSVMVNPHGIKMLLYPYQNMTDHLMLSNISEWQSSNLNTLAHYPYFVICLFILSIILFSKKKIRFIDFVLFLLMLFLGLKSIRFWVYIYIVSTYFIFYYISERDYDKGSCLILNIFSLMLCFLFCLEYKTILNNMNEKLVSDQMISVIKSESPKRLYNNYDYGGYLIYKGIKVFVDGRCDLYSKYTYSDYISISNLGKDYQEFIDKYQFDYFLVDSQFPIYYYLKYSDNYKLLISDDGLFLYQKVH